MRLIRKCHLSFMLCLHFKANTVEPLQFYSYFPSIANHDSRDCSDYSDCSDGSDSSDGADCSDCSDCSDGSDGSVCSDCSDGSVCSDCSDGSDGSDCSDGSDHSDCMAQMAQPAQIAQFAQIAQMWLRSRCFLLLMMSGVQLKQSVYATSLYEIIVHWRSEQCPTYCTNLQYSNSTAGWGLTHAGADNSELHLFSSQWWARDIVKVPLYSTVRSKRHLRSFVVDDCRPSIKQRMTLRRQSGLLFVAASRNPLFQKG